MTTRSFERTRRAEEVLAGGGEAPPQAVPSPLLYFGLSTRLFSLAAPGVIPETERVYYLFVCGCGEVYSIVCASLGFDFAARLHVLLLGAGFVAKNARPGLSSFASRAQCRVRGGAPIENCIGATHTSECIQLLGVSGIVRRAKTVKSERAARWETRFSDLFCPAGQRRTGICPRDTGQGNDIFSSSGGTVAAARRSPPGGALRNKVQQKRKRERWRNTKYALPQS